MKIDRSGFPSLGLLLGTEATLDPFSYENHRRAKVAHRLAEMEEDCAAIHSIHPEMLRHGRVERLECVGLSQCHADIFESRRGRRLLGFTSGPSTDPGANDQKPQCCSKKMGNFRFMTHLLRCDLAHCGL